MKLSKGSVPVSVKLIEIFREIKKKCEIFPLVSPRTLSTRDLVRILKSILNLLTESLNLVWQNPRQNPPQDDFSRCGVHGEFDR